MGKSKKKKNCWSNFSPTFFAPFLSSFFSTKNHNNWWIFFICFVQLSSHTAWHLIKGWHKHTSCASKHFEAEGGRRESTGCWTRLQLWPGSTSVCFIRDEKPRTKPATACRSKESSESLSVSSRATRSGWKLIASNIFTHSDTREPVRVVHSHSSVSTFGSHAVKLFSEILNIPEWRAAQLTGWCD